jgi:rhodanese-related sulfurtransferase
MYTPSTVTSAELNELLKRDSGPRMIDVRTPAEFETVHIPGAYNVPLDLLREHRDEIATHVDDDVVLVCRSGQRAGVAEEALRRAGQTNVRVLDGGMIAWQSEGFDTSHRTQRWDLKSQVRLAAGSLVLCSVLRSVAAPTLRWIATRKAR